MGRETKILLGLLGLLAGVFVGVLSMKLLVPRPPTGAGPDIQGDVASSEPHDLVEPPRFGMRASDFASAPPLTPPLDTPPAPQEPAAPQAGSRFAMPPRDSAAAEPVSPAGPRRDPFVAAASFEPEVTPESPTTGAEFTGGDSTADGSRFAATQSAEPPQQPVGTPRLITPAPAIGPMAGAGYVVQEGDSWWSVAERAYGDGRLYRALFAWNRGLNPRITLAVGTPLEIPPRSRLAVAWPRFMPQD